MGTGFVPVSTIARAHGHCFISEITTFRIFKTAEHKYDIFLLHKKDNNILENSKLAKLSLCRISNQINCKENKNI